MTSSQTYSPLEQRGGHSNNNNNNNNNNNSHEGIKVYTAEQDIPEPSLIEVELAIEKLKRHKATGVDHIPSELIQVGEGKLYKENIKSLYSFGKRKNCHKNGKIHYCSNS